ncbi:UvrD-helicase domain-containing protein [Macellibacteroides fermentans]|uniref:UvrD-helicase domain-containing protein n=1 Tax=Macellibacteroides fermentans TaxID=879969 RepID=UPI00406C7689
MATSITSNDLIPIERHFRVSAGPGAGKTYWLVNHIKNVLHTSTRLSKTRKVACITYTNVAAETILTRLGMSSDRVEVSTIHSFLYKHIVKPYAKFIADDYDLNVKKMEGHDDYILSNYPFLFELKQGTAQQWIKDDTTLIGAISKARWKFNSEGELVTKPDYPIKIGKYAIKNETYLMYKHMAWSKGIIHHDDVLYFSYQLLIRFPFILDILRAKFPYFFIDEFQDSNPIQVRILKLIGLAETKIGIIGDKAQSIYGFQGADAKQFETFILNGIVDYMMFDNRRSTNQIIDCLNIVRSSFIQNKFNNIDGELPYILVGDRIFAYSKAKELSSSEIVHTLSYQNIVSNAMKKEMNSDVPTNNLFNDLFKIDSNNTRRTTISICIKATELALQKQYKDAKKELEKLFNDQTDLSKKEVFKYLGLLINNYHEYSNASLLEYYSFVNSYIRQIPKPRKGDIFEFYSSISYRQMAVCVNIIEDNSLHKTIHKSKGDEFDNVILILKNENDLNFLFIPDLDENEEHRVFYVAMSRAKKRLFISLPALSSTNRDRLTNIPIIVKEL